MFRSDLADRLPAGLRLPRCLAIDDLDDAAAVWLEVVEHDPAPWEPDRYALAARALGRLAGSPEVAGIDPAVLHPTGPRQARAYLDGRLRGQFVAAYADEDLWRHPALAATVDRDTRDRLTGLIDRADRLVDEIEALPAAVCHGDACPQNLLWTPDGLVAIDWALFSRTRIGFDLSQLVISEIDLGRAPGSSLRDTQTVAVAAYRDGLADVGVDVGADELARAHTIQLAIASGISVIPLDRLAAGDSPALRAHLRSQLEAFDAIVGPLGL